MKREATKHICMYALCAFIFSLFVTTAFASPDRRPPIQRSETGGEGFWHTGLPSSALRAWYSTVQVRLIKLGGKRKARRGFRVGSGLILAVNPEKREALIVTTHHSVNPNRKLYRCEVRFPRQSHFVTGFQQYYPTRRVKILMAKPGKDLIYLKAKYPRNARPTPAALRVIDNIPYYSEALISIGFPYLALRPREGWNVPRPKNYKQVIKRYSMGKLLAKSASNNNVSILAHNADILKGNSGGPLVDDDGKVIGINAAMIYPNGIVSSDSAKYNYCPGDSQHYYVAISSSEIVKDFLRIKQKRLW